MAESRAVLEVVEPGLLTTVQDAGRPDAVALGVPVGGACDGWSLRVANALAGNDGGAAALEITLTGPTLRVLADCRVGLAGADLEARVQPGARPFEPGTGRLLRQGETITFGAAQSGVRAYLAVGGGIDVPQVLGSSSTCLVGRFGGLDGRPLVAGDVIRGGGTLVGSTNELRWPNAYSPPTVATAQPLRVLSGPHGDRLDAGAFERLLATNWTVSARGDRQGIRLQGPVLPVDSASAEQLSEGVVWGAIQLPPDGQPICLLADRQTVGGYPVIAVVISADLPALGQLGAADSVRFRPVSADEAVQALRDQDELFSSSTRRLATT